MFLFELTGERDPIHCLEAAIFAKMRCSFCWYRGERKSPENDLATHQQTLSASIGLEGKEKEEGSLKKEKISRRGGPFS